MGKLVAGNDGLPAEEVGIWVKEKHDCLCSYVDITRATRRKFIDPGRAKSPSIAGATYIDLFCGPGQAYIEETREFIDGGCVAAWQKSKEGGAPFSKIYIADKDVERREAAFKRLQKLNAPVRQIEGDALQASFQLKEILSREALHFAYLDPYNLNSLHFDILKNLCSFKRMDILVHYSQQDMQRNLARNIAAEHSAFDAFIPGWRSEINTKEQSRLPIRTDIFDYWKSLIVAEGKEVDDKTLLIKGSKNQPLYWLALIAGHDLAKRFWKTSANLEKQGTLF